MKLALITAILFLSFPVWAQKIWVQTPETQIPAGDISYSSFLAGKYKNIGDREEIPAWGQAYLEKESLDPAFFSQLESFETIGIFSENDRSFLLDVMSKLMLKPMTADQKKQLQNLYCRWALLDGKQDETGSISCPAQMVDLMKIKNLFPFTSKIMIEDKEFDLRLQLQASALTEGVYNWRILSDSHKALSFHGRFSELLAMSGQPEKLVQGDCDSFTHSLDDLEVLSRGWVFFNENCKKSLKAPETSTIAKWYEENKSWVVPVGIAVLSAAAYQLRDKKLVITKPHF